MQYSFDHYRLDNAKDLIPLPPRKSQYLGQSAQRGQTAAAVWPHGLSAEIFRE